MTTNVKNTKVRWRCHNCYDTFESEAGYIVKVYGTNISPEINVESATKRFQKKGRYVPIEYIVENTPKINKSVLEVSKYADESRIYDTSVKGRENAKVIYSKES